MFESCNAELDIMKIPRQSVFDSAKFLFKCLFFQETALTVDHYVGIFYFNDTFYYYDDLESSMKQITEYTGTISCVIYHRFF